MTATMKPTSPQAVSACLRKNGWMPTPRQFEGVHVTRSYKSASVSCDWNSTVESQQQAALMVEVLEAAGYVVEVNPNNSALLCVVGRKVA